MGSAGFSGSSGFLGVSGSPTDIYVIVLLFSCPRNGHSRQNKNNLFQTAVLENFPYELCSPC